MALDKSVVSPPLVPRSAALPAADLYSAMPSSYAAALGDAAAQLEGLLGRLGAVQAQLQSGAASGPMRQELTALRARLLAVSAETRARHGQLPQLLQLEESLQAARDEGASKVQDELDQLAQAGQQLQALQQQAARRAAQRDAADPDELVNGALRQAARQLSMGTNATALQSHADEDGGGLAQGQASAVDLGLSPGQERALRHMQARTRAEVGAAGEQPLAAAKKAQLQTNYGDMLTHMQQAGGANLQAMPVEALVQKVLADAYATSGEDMRNYALRVDYFTELRGSLREEITKARRFLSDNAGAEALSVPYTRQRFSTLALVDADGSLRLRQAQPDGNVSSSKQLEEYIKGLETQLTLVGEDNQLAQLKLQQMVQRQQQMMQTLSNLAKVFHETHMSIIRKLGS